MTTDKKLTFMGITIIILLLILIGLNLSRHPFGGRRSPFRNHEKMFQKMLKKIEATPSQAKDLTEYKDSHKDEIRELHSTMETLKENIRNELLRENPDFEKIKTFHIQIKENMSAAADHMLKMILHTHKTLNKEQFEKLHKHMEKMMKKHRPPHEGPMGEKPPRL